MAAETISPDAQEYIRRINYYCTQCVKRTQAVLAQHTQALNWIKKRLHLQHPEQRLREQTQTLDQLEVRLHRSIKANFNVSQQTLAHLAKNLQTLSPLATLSRGYAIVYNDKKVVTSVKDAAPGDTLITHLADGKIMSKVT